MFEPMDLVRGFLRYLAALALAWIASVVAIAALGGDAEPGTLSRAIAVLVFFIVFVGLLAKDDLVAFWHYVRE